DPHGRAFRFCAGRPRDPSRAGGCGPYARARALMPVTSPDYYEVLGVPRDASLDAVRQAYRKLARKFHPDVNREPGAEDRFKAISEADDVLRDPDKRAQYDRYGAVGAGTPGGSRGGPGFSGGNGSRDVGFDFTEAD